MQFDLRDKVVMVTGSARRVGRAILLAFASRGANVVIHHSQSDTAAAQTAAQAEALGVAALVVKGDHSQHDEIAANFAAVAARFGRLDVLVNSAGVFPKGDLLEIPPEEWQYVLGLNLTAPYWCTQHAGRMMRDQGIHGCIINIADNGGLRGWTKRPHHSIAKAGVVMLTQITAKALAKYQIRANCIVPGPVLPADDMDAKYWDRVVQRLPLRRAGDPDDVARAAVFLVENDFMTGTLLHVDGGEFLGEPNSG